MSSSESSLDSDDDFDGFDNDIGREEDDVRNVFEDDEGAGYEAHNLDPLDREANYIDNDEDEDFQITGTVLQEMDKTQHIYNWLSDTVPSCNPSFQPKQKPGPTIQNALPSSLDYFHLFFEEQYLEKVCVLTNKNAVTRSEDSEIWTPISLPELKAYFGVWLVIETQYKDRIEALWSNSKENFMCNVPGVREVFTRDRYRQITRFLHFCDESHAKPKHSAEYDKLYKVRPLLNQLKSTFQENYVPDCEVAVDECMVPFRGRLSFKQYMRDKPIKWGIKVFLLAESSSGYNFNFEVYTGKDCCYGHMVNLGLGERIVLSLASPLYDRGYHIYCDRFFTSASLLAKLALLKLCACGTVLPRRLNFPKDLVCRHEKDMKRGESDFRMCAENGGIVATVWADKKPIYFLSTAHIADKGSCIVKRNDGRGKSIEVPATPSVVAYNKYMGGVDINDRMTSIDKSRRTYKWYQRLVRKCLMWAMYNAYIIEGHFVPHKPTGKRNRDFRKFVLEVAHLLVGTWRRKSVVPKMGHNPKRLSLEDHEPVVGNSVNGRCVVCSERNRRFIRKHPGIRGKDIPEDDRAHKSVFLCNSLHCDVYLCIKKASTCWQKWHKNLDFWL